MTLTNPPPGMVAVPLQGAVPVIPERVYLAGLRLGKQLRRREALAQWTEARKGEHERHAS